MRAALTILLILGGWAAFASAQETGTPGATPFTPKGDGDPLDSSGDIVQMKPMTKEQLAWNSVKVAGIQMELAPGEDGAAKIGGFIDRAARDGAQLVVFPEYILGKTKVSDPVVESIRATAKQNGIYVVVGLFEIVDDTGRYGNCALLINRQGEIQGRYFKVHPAIGDVPYFWPPKPDDIEWTMEKGDGFPVFDLDFGRIGILTCYDGYFPEPYRILALKGAEILIWINSRDGSIEDYMVKTAMAQNYVHMVCVNNAHGAGTMVAEWPTRIIEMASEPGEHYVCAELPLTLLRTVRKNGGRELRQRRPDLYRELIKSYPVWEQYSALEDKVAPGQKPAAEKAAPADRIELTPVSEEFRKRSEPGLRPGEDLFRIGFRARAPWMTQGAELRFPEVLRSSLGMHVLDHFSPTLAPVSEIDPLPQWRTEDSGAIAYTCATPEGLTFDVRAIPGTDEVALEFTVTNRSAQPIEGIEQNSCLHLGASPEFNAPNDLTRLFAVYGGRFQGLAGTTPTPAEMGRTPWLLLLTRSGQDTFDGPKVSPTWWRVDQIAEENLMAAASVDGKHLLGYTWDREGPHMMSNGGNPCLHTGPDSLDKLAPGESFAWRGKLYFVDNDLDALLARYRADKAAWSGK